MSGHKKDSKLSAGETTLYVVTLVVFVGLLCVNIYSVAKSEEQIRDLRKELNMIQLECEPVDNPIPEDVNLFLSQSIERKVM